MQFGGYAAVPWRQHNPIDEGTDDLARLVSSRFRVQSILKLGDLFAIDAR